MTCFLSLTSLWIECVIYRKDRKHPISIREYLDEVYRPPAEPWVDIWENGQRTGQKEKRKFNGPWQSHTKRMLRHKAMIQCARVAFGFVGIYDQDEAERIMEINITPEPTTVKQSSASAVRNVMDDVDAQQGNGNKPIEGEFQEGTERTSEVSERASGWEAGGGVAIVVTRRLALNPGIRYSTVSPGFSGREELRMRYLLVDLGLLVGF